MSKIEWNLGWNDDAKVAAILYCYLSLDKTEGEEKGKHFTALVDVKQNLDWYLSTVGLKTAGEKLPEDDADLETYLNGKLKKVGLPLVHTSWQIFTTILGGKCQAKPTADYELVFSPCMVTISDVKEEIVNYYDEVIAKFPDDERYECIVEEMDRLAADSNSGFTTFNSRKFLWGFVIYSVSAGILTGEKQKYLNHFCRIAGLEKSVLSEMEETAKSIVALGKKRLEAKASDETYSKVIGVLETLDTDEQALHEKVSTLLYPGENTEDDRGDGEESSHDKIYEPWADDDSPLHEKIGGATMNILECIANGLEDFAAKI
ncbi:hypothetical protein AGMMS49546_35920 [Spirochaetia bacterium]|nr:hypothetical protein AGMMS49546_35920 [Spirochaetia bacterium]